MSRNAMIYRNTIAYFIPGAVLVLSLRWFLDGFVGMNLTPWDAGGIGGAALVIFGSWVFGYVAQLLSKALLTSLNDFEGKLPAQFLQDSDAHFTAEFKSELAACVQKSFGMALSNPDVYPLCVAFINERQAGSLVERERSLSGLMRGLLVVSKLVFAASIVIVLKQLALAILPRLDIVLPVTGFLTFDEANLVLGIILLVITAIAARFLSRYAMSASESVVTAVYRSFFVACKQNRE